MKARTRRRKRIFRQVRTNLLVLLAFLVIGGVSYQVLRNELLKNAKETGTALAKSYAAEERNNLTVYETLIAFGAEAIDWRVQEGAGRENIQSWITMYFQRLEDVLGEGTVDPYAIVNGQIVAANPWEGMEEYDAFHAPWYQAALEADGQVVFTDVYTDSVYQRPVITVAQKCRVANGVLALDIFAEQFQFKTNLLDLPEGAVFFLCDSAGNLIYAQTDLKSPRAELEAYVTGLLDRVNQGKLENYDAYIIDQDGRQRSIYHSTMSNGWTALVTVPYDTILRELRQASAVFCLVFLFCLLSVSFLTWREFRLSARMERANETAAVLGNSCYALYRVDVFQDTYEIIKGSDYVKERLPKTGRYEDLTRVVSEVIEEDACQEYLDSFSAASLQKLSVQGVREFGGDFLRRGSGSFFGYGSGLLGGSFLLHGGVHRGFGALGVIHYRIRRDLLGRGALSEEGLFLCGGRRGLLGLLGDRLFGSGYLFDGSGDFLRCGSFQGGSRRGDFLSCGSRRDGLHRRGSAQADLAVIVVDEGADGSVRVIVDEFAFEELDLVVVVIEVNEGTHKQSPNYP